MNRGFPSNVLTCCKYVSTLSLREETTIPTDKRSITFYADPEIEAWYESLPTSVRSRTINELLKKAIAAPDEKLIVSEKIDKHDSLLRELISLVTILTQEQIVACEQKSKSPQAKALKKRLKTALSGLEQT
ncbi:MAG: hypothetical protein C0469_05625 [Cyanobacteria bacterium DS2.3.42]|nr:hypothetical protein [Cyanobacteria bacterium DS2.3.42]